MELGDDHPRHGSTGTIGSQVVQRLAAQSARTRALVRDASKAKFPAGVEPVQADTTDIAPGISLPLFC